MELFGHSYAGFGHTATYVSLEGGKRCYDMRIVRNIFVCLALNDSGLGADILCCCTYISERFLQ